MLGLTARLTISALQVAGSVIAQQMGLGFVTAVDPTQGQQGMIVGNFLTLLGVTLIFATDLHHLVIAALNDSYRCSGPARCRSSATSPRMSPTPSPARSASASSCPAPFLVFGLLFNLGLGVLSRLMPQMQVFFVGMPLSILIGFLILLLVVGAMMGDLPRLCRRRAARARAVFVRSDAWPTNKTIPNDQKTRHRSGSTRRSSAATSSRARRSTPGSCSRPRR